MINLTQLKKITPAEWNKNYNQIIEVDCGHWIHCKITSFNTKRVFSFTWRRFWYSHGERFSELMQCVDAINSTEAPIFALHKIFKHYVLCDVITASGRNAALRELEAIAYPDGGYINF